MRGIRESISKQVKVELDEGECFLENKFLVCKLLRTNSENGLFEGLRCYL